MKKDAVCRKIDATRNKHHRWIKAASESGIFYVLSHLKIYTDVRI